MSSRIIDTNVSQYMKNLLDPILVAFHSILQELFVLAGIYMFSLLCSFSML